jgi:autotransporter passenger strand-loop-strand repeat protein
MTDFTVPSGITSTGITVSNGDTWIIDGTAVSFTISNGGTEAVSSGGSAVSTTVSSGGYEYVYSGGTANFTTVSSGVEVVSNGTTTNTTVNNGGYEYVYSGGTTSFTAVSGGGFDPAAPPPAPWSTAAVPSSSTAARPVSLRSAAEALNRCTPAARPSVPR